MTLRTRVFVLLVGLLAMTLLAVWTMTTGGVLQPLIAKLEQERVEVAVHIAEQVEAADVPRERFRELQQQLGVRGHFAPTPPPRIRQSSRSLELRGRDVWVFRGPGSPIAVSVAGPRGRQGWMVLLFPADLDAPQRRIAMGLGLLGLMALGAGVVVVQWMLRPLEVASEAMARVADGDLTHRAPTGSDAAGRMGHTFNRMVDRVEGLVQGQRDLMAAVSHELRTPLTRMRLHTELLREEGADPARIDALERGIASVDGLVEELLESARLDQGVLALQRAPILLADLVGDALGGVDLGERSVTVAVAPGASAWADHKRMHRVLANLLSNVARYTPPTSELSVTGGVDGGSAWVEVADRGPGVAPESLDRLFDPFFREETSRSRRTGGLGLGLMLCRQIAEAHGGHITARNRVGGGLVVRLVVPSEPASGASERAKSPEGPA